MEPRPQFASALLTPAVPAKGATLCRATIRGAGALKYVLLALAVLLFLPMPTSQAKGQHSNAASTQAPRPWDQNPDGMHIFIWAGLKSHSAGQHDYPQFLADWSKLLTEHGAVVDGALHPPSMADLEHTDVVIIYKGDAAYLSDEEKS